MDDVLEPDHPRARAVLDGYMRAFETADAAAFERLFRADAVLEVSPSGTWFAGMRDCVASLMRHVTLAEGDWRTVPTAANGHPAFAGYQRDADGVYRGYGLGVLTVTETGIATVSVFGGVEHLTRFGLPTTLPELPPGPWRLWRGWLGTEQLEGAFRGASDHRAVTDQHDGALDQ
jgi:RNA polymerase sigma-70 factor (ECF subfamily)